MTPPEERRLRAGIKVELRHPSERSSKFGYSVWLKVAGHSVQVPPALAYLITEAVPQEPGVGQMVELKPGEMPCYPAPAKPTLESLAAQVQALGDELRGRIEDMEGELAMHTALANASTDRKEETTSDPSPPTEGYLTAEEFWRKDGSDG